MGLQAKIPLPKAIFNGFLPVTVRVLNSYKTKTNNMCGYMEEKKMDYKKAGKSRSIKGKQLKNSRSTVSKQHVVLRSSASDNLQLKNAKKARKYAIFRAFSMPEIT